MIGVGDLSLKAFMKRTFLVFLGTLCILSYASAFEIRTHAALTREAWSRFLLDDPDALDRLGIKNADDAFNTTGYYDFRPTEEVTPIRRYSSPQYEDGMIEALNEPRFSIQGWLMRGAIREDDDINP